MDFYNIVENESKKNGLDIYPDFQAIRSNDIMTRGGAFYGVFDKNTNFWNTDEYAVVKLIDDHLYEYYEEVKAKRPGLERVNVKSMRSFSSNSYINFTRFLKTVPDNYTQLDNKLVFANTEITREDYVSKCLPYELKEGSYDSWDELIGTLYEPEERDKIEWAIGSIFSGDSRNIQKFLVLYGDPGSGKGTILDIIQKLFDGYYTTFDAKALGGSNNQFATEAFRSNPLVAIQHDGDLSRIEDNTKLNSIISHEEMMLQEKYKSSYTGKMNAFLFMGTNKPVKITDSRSGIIRRLIDVQPSGNKIPEKRYHIIKDRVQFELGAIANYCLNKYRSMGKEYYSNYKPHAMMAKTDAFYNFVEENYFLFKEMDGVELKHAYDMYKEYCEESSMPFKMKKMNFTEELRSYFHEYLKDTSINGERKRNYFKGFKYEKFQNMEPPEQEHALPLKLDCTESLFDRYCANEIAQYATKTTEIPMKAWDNVESTLSDLDTSQLHYVKLPLNHIVIDFDIKDDSGNKSYELNLEAASKWPPTYAEVSKGGNGIHLHYLYDGDPEQLSRLYSKDIEIKVFSGNSSLRRRLSLCNNIDIATISSGLPFKEEKVVSLNVVRNEKHLRALLAKALRKEIHAGTKPNMDFIKKILDDAYDANIPYNVEDMSHDFLLFATGSSNQSEYCLALMSELKLQSESSANGIKTAGDELIFFDVEVFPNLFIIVWKKQGVDKYIQMINPSPAEVGALFQMNLIGFNVRRYDNHILYARYLGYDNHQLYQLSKAIIGNEKKVMFGEAYNISYTDIYEYSTKKQGLKKWEIELGIPHKEMECKWDIPEGVEVWDHPVPEEYWQDVADYCINDVMATEVVFEHTESDYVARLILAELSGLTANDTTQQHTARIIFGNDPNPQNKFIYTDLSKEFPGYIFERGKSYYKGVETGEGGYVYSKPGMYGNVLLLDIASQHPNSAIIMEIFGEYTKNYEALMNSRLAIKHNDPDLARETLGQLLSNVRRISLNEGIQLIDDLLEKFNIDMDGLSFGLKIPINIVYGMTSAKFPNKFKDPRNIDNIVAKRGALFMVDLKEACEARGYNVVHIKTDSIKIADGNDEIKAFVMEFGRKYGYTFEHEATYDKMCLVNKAVYIAKYGWAEKAKKIGKWEATGAQFAHPYIYKTLFTGENTVFEDFCEAKSVKTTMYLDFNEHLVCEDMIDSEKQIKKLDTAIRKAERVNPGEKGWLNPTEYQQCVDERNRLAEYVKQYHNYVFVGKVGSFIPIKPGMNGGELMRKSDGKYHSVTGTKDYRWNESENIGDDWEDIIDLRYYSGLKDTAINAIEQFGNFDWFISDMAYDPADNGIIPF